MVSQENHVKVTSKPLEQLHLAIADKLSLLGQTVRLAVYSPWWSTQSSISCYTGVVQLGRV